MGPYEMKSEAKLNNELVRQVLEGEIVDEPVGFVDDLNRLSTSALKTYIRKVVEVREGLEGKTKLVLDHQVDAITELCTRYDAGDIAAFFQEINWAPTKEQEKLIIKINANNKVSQATTAVVVGKTTNAVKNAVRRAKSKMSESVPADTNSDKSDNGKVIDWEKAERLAADGMSLLQIAKQLGVEESRVRRDMGVRQAKAKVDPDFDINGASQRHYDKTIACDIEPADEVIHDVKMLIRRLLSPVYTLNARDKKNLVGILREALTKLEGE